MAVSFSFLFFFFKSSKSLSPHRRFGKLGNPRKSVEDGLNCSHGRFGKLGNPTKSVSDGLNCSLWRPVCFDQNSLAAELVEHSAGGLPVDVEEFGGLLLAQEESPIGVH